MVYLEASKCADVEKNSLVAIWIQPTALQHFHRAVGLLPLFCGFPKTEVNAIARYDMFQYVQISVRRGYDIAVGQFGNGANGPLGRNNCLLE